ncbi:MAG: hypothetical protein HQM01_05025 [Magnetococcales bacterium]|nr:hypothetical protein [Magnetococcales bacterium]
MYDLLCFLSVMAGRAQSPNGIKVQTTETDKDDSVIRIYQSYKNNIGNKYRKPHAGDILIDSIRNPDEFSIVLSKWICLHKNRKIARYRYDKCLRKGNVYSINRLVAAANMFDLLPEDALPSSYKLDDTLNGIVGSCIEQLRKLPSGIDRDSALSALKRLGKPSLPKKVVYRAHIVDSELGDSLPDLQFVAKEAIKCRNYFVHGSHEYNIERIQPFIHFLTDSLEFIFVISDFIDSGWRAKNWLARAPGISNNFGLFIDGYKIELRRFKEVIGS